MADATIQREDIRPWAGVQPQFMARDNGDGTYSEQVAVAPAQLTEHTFTVASGQSESAEADLNNEAIVAVYPPAAVDATTVQLSIKRGLATGSRATLRDVYGTRKVITFTAGEPVEVPADWAKHNRFTSIVLETSAGAAVAQSAERVFIIVTRAV